MTIGDTAGKIKNVQEFDLTQIYNLEGDRFKLAAFGGLMNAIIDKTDNLAAVCYEKPFHRGLKSTNLLLGMAGIVAASILPEVALYSVAPVSVKKFATGNGGASKKDMIDEAQKFFPTKFLTDNEADSIHIYRYGVMKHKERKNNNG